MFAALFYILLWFCMRFALEKQIKDSKIKNRHEFILHPHRVFATIAQINADMILNYESPRFIVLADVTF